MKASYLAKHNGFIPNLNTTVHSKLPRFKNKSYGLWLVTNQLGFKFKSKRFIFLNIFGFIPNVCSFKSNL